jgi:SWI/SNF-related matrix-associated actin-dependent regulator 1 of chromatin subfamily A
LKNPESQRYQNLIKIEAKFRLLLTGTPLQNNLRELVAILAFILPDVFKGLTEDLEFIFKAKATTSDSDHAQLLSKQRIDRARSILTPFVLRRKKEQVLKHLPAKARRVVYTEMPKEQTEIYDGLKKIFKKEIDDTKDAKAIKATRATKASKAVNASENNNPLMQLRKAAIHPLLFRRHFDDAKIKTMANLLRKNYPEEFKPSDKFEYLIQEMSAMSDFVLHTWCKIYPAIKSFDIKNLSWLDSGKVQALVELLKQYKKDGDKALVFSQFSGVLDILEEVLSTIKIKFARIDGSTPVKERQPLINDFNNIEEITVFLLTTKAGGTGINLVSANKVIIFDSSFNPQDDRQAENRAHRYGQKRDVEVVILVSKNTIEEKILALGESKLELDERVAEAAIEDAVREEEAGADVVTITS